MAANARRLPYNLTDDGVTEIITGSLPTHQASSCWMEVTPDGRYAYTTNPADSSISGVEIAADGSLSLINGQDFLVESNDPRDQETSADGRYLYVLNNEGAFVDGYQVNENGPLKLITTQQGALPALSNGLAAF